MANSIFILENEKKETFYFSCAVNLIDALKNANLNFDYCENGIISFKELEAFITRMPIGAGLQFSTVTSYKRSLGLHAGERNNFVIYKKELF